MWLVYLLSFVCVQKTYLVPSFVSFQGERLSHAVGCAFAACLERKQKREKECGVTATFDASRTTFTREGSFRVTTATEQAEREEVMRQIQDTKGNGIQICPIWNTGCTVLNQVLPRNCHFTCKAPGTSSKLSFHLQSTVSFTSR